MSGGVDSSVVAAQLAEEAGFDSFAVPDSICFPEESDSTYPYNPYPFPWVNHLFQDAPSIAIGIFEGLLADPDMDPDTKAQIESDLESARDGGGCP